MGISRRDLLGLIAALPVAARAIDAKSGPSAPDIFSAAADGRGGYRLAALDRDGNQAFSVPLPTRGHGTALHPDGRQLACIARRPGDFLLVVDAADGSVLAQARTPLDRHLYGHGVYSGDGALLYTTENALPSGEGRIGIWDVSAGYSRIGDLPTHGIGPHELLLAPDGERLIVAIGGILTRPETGRAKLNLDAMRPALVYLDRHRGELIAEHRLDEALHRCSIRHIALGYDGTVFAAMQYQGPASDRAPLVAMQRPGGDLEPLSAGDEVQNAMRGYCGSVAADRSGEWIAVSAPRGNLVTIWDGSGRYHTRVQVPDGCGIAATARPGGFLLSSGTGGLWHYEIATADLTELATARDQHLQWDNHLATLPAA